MSETRHVVPWYMQINSRGRWLRKHIRLQSQSRRSWAIAQIASVQASWALRGSR